MRRLVVCDECIPQGLAVLLGEHPEVLAVRKLALAGRTDDVVLRALQALPALRKAIRRAEPGRVMEVRAAR